MMSVGLSALVRNMIIAAVVTSINTAKHVCIVTGLNSVVITAIAVAFFSISRVGKLCVMPVWMATLNACCALAALTVMS